MQQSEETNLPPLRERITYPRSSMEEKYPYDDWFDGSVWKLKMYEDFWVDPKSMQSAVYQSAKKRGFKVKTHIPRSADVLYVQAIKQ